MSNFNIEINETLNKIKESTKTRILLILFFLSLAIILDLIIKVPFEKLVIYGILILMLVSTLLTYFIVKRWRPPSYQALNNIYIIYLIFDLFLLTIIVYYLGGVTWIIPIVYILYIIYGFLFFPQIHAYILLIFSVLFLSILVGLVYWEVIPYKHIFLLSPTIYKDFSFVITTILILITGFYWIGRYCNIFSYLLKEKVKKAESLKSQIEEARTILEIKVQARTRELKELTENLDEQVKKRTKELRERINELERFQKVTVGRELRMLELKKEIKKLKEEIEELKGKI